MSLQAEFQVIIMAGGKGSRMPEITSGKPKCLLPVGQKPLIWFPLNNLHLCGFTECIIVVLDNQKHEVQSTVDKFNLGIKAEYFSIPSNEDLGTADSLRLLHDKLHSDVLVLPCDLITNTDLNSALDIFRTHNATITSLFMKPQQPDAVLVPGPKPKHKPERDLVGIDVQTSRLVFLASLSDFETDVSIPLGLMKKHPHIKMYSTLVDSHVYVMRNWVIGYLKNEEKISTLKGEFLPHIVRKQLAKVPQKVEEANASIVDSHHSDDIFSFAKEDDMKLLVREMSAFNDHAGDSNPTYHGDCIRCFAHITDADEFGVRVNTLPVYCSVNNKIIENWSKIVPNEPLVLKNPKADIKSTQVDDKCVIWEGAKLKEKTSFKESIIGSGVEVNSFSRVFNTILMKNVVVKERVALENCIVSDGAIIGTGTQLKSCLVGSHYNVPDQSQHCNEVLTDVAQLMEF
ncbi:hypothetical protein WA026_017208 [Henosepilachna vigintioctopunctata]|uniref:Translation initiation factor eIF2B subunit gamma n=1 Tax=Henosepilachna vigintioctopunctata TaxID=420089 RepID=A0AAW1ULN4_9CUCU